MLIGLHGPAQSGKDTIYQMIAEQSNCPVRREAFADRLKLSAMRALGFDGPLDDCLVICDMLKADGGQVKTSWDEDDFPRGLTISGREFLQYYGTEAHRDVFDQDFWVKAVLPDDWEDSDNEILVITDVRFPNEAQRVHYCGGVLWRVDRPAIITESSHASEKPLPMELVDYILRNHGSLDDLRDAVNKALVNGVLAVS